MNLGDIQNSHIHQGSEKSYDHQIFIITAEISTNQNLLRDC